MLTLTGLRAARRQDWKMPEILAPSAFQIVGQLAALPAVHRAFQWFHLQEPKLREWHRQVVAIPAPSFGEEARAAWLVTQFRALGLEDVHIDSCGNALGWLRAAPERSRSAGSLAASSGSSPRHGCILFSAHLDTVFPADAIGEPVQDGSRLTAPGACDNCAGITALLAVAAAMQASGLRPFTDILFAGNVGEEGEGNLRGMRYLFTASPFARQIRSAVILDGAGIETIVAHGLGSRRFRVTILGPGGHSWTDAGMPNPILVLANILSDLGRIELPSTPRTTWNVGHIEGGTSINTVPQSAQARIDTRSTDPAMLQRLEVSIYRAVEDAVLEANAAAGARGADGPLRFQIELIGDRPGANLPEDAAILTRVRAVDRHLNIQSNLRIASTDANIPLSLGIEALSIGSGGRGGGIHTREEWFDATGRDLALRRILLLLLAQAQGDN